MADYENNESIKIFREYLRIPSVQPNINYDECVSFLRRQAARLALPVRVLELVPRRPVVLITWEGREPAAPAVLLNSHMDVVPVFEHSWSHPPFAAHMDAEGRIFARGAQDMKCVGVQYLEAVARLRAAGRRPRRTLHISFVPDEEIGGDAGMKAFVRSPEWRALNVGFALDEGMASPGPEYLLFYGERTLWHLHVHCAGPPGHGSLLLQDTAGEKLRFMIDKFMDYRAAQQRRLAAPGAALGDVTTVNLNQVYGGVQSNVIPEKLTAVFDVRIAVDQDVAELEEQVRGWAAAAGGGVTLEFEQRNEPAPATPLVASNPFWTAFKAAADDMGLRLQCRVFPAATDCRYVRAAGVPALGFSPIDNTPVLLHDHDEFLAADVFLRGIDVYERLIAAVADVE